MEKINKNIAYFLIFFFSISVYFISKIVLLGSLQLISYTNPTFNVSFNHPYWNICDFSEKGQSVYKSVAVADPHPVSKFGVIENRLKFDCDAIEAYRHLIVTDLNIETNETDIKVWLDTFSTENSIEPGQLPKAGLVPIEGVSEWKFVQYANNLIVNQPNNTVAEAVYYADESTQYLVLNNNRIFAVKFNPMLGIRSLPLKSILKTLNLNDQKNI